MSDILTRLQLDTSSFDTGMKKSEAQMKSFDKTGSALTAGLKSFGLAIGAGVSAIEIFNKAMNSSQDISDAYNRVIEVAKTSTDNFIYSFTNFDFTPFVSGMAEVISLAKQAADAFDQLGNTKISFDFLSTKNMAAFQEQIAAIRDPYSSKAQKKEAYSTASGVVKTQQGYVSNYNKRIMEAYNADIRKYAGTPNVNYNAEDITKVMKIDVGSDYAGARKRIAKEYAKYQKELKVLYGQNTHATVSSSNYGTMITETVDYGKVQSKRIPIDKKFKDIILAYTMLNRWSDEKLKEMTDLISQSDAASISLSGMQKTLSRSSKTALGAGSGSAAKGKSTKAAEPVYGEGSIAYIDQQLSAWRKKFNEATTTEARAAANTLINDLENRKVMLQVIAEYGAPEVGLMNTDKKSGIKGIKGKNPNEDVKGMTFPDLSDSNKQISGTTDNVAGMEEALNALSSAFGSMNGMVSGGAANWIQWGANAVKAIAQTIPMIVALTGVTTAEATANVAAGASAAGKSVAATPFVGAVLAVAAIASFIAAMASVPKYATGGIVGGSSRTGDRILAGINSGELILNEAQQNNLAGKLTSINRSVTVGGSFKLVGRDLIAAIDSNNRKYSRT